MIPVYVVPGPAGAPPAGGVPPPPPRDGQIEELLRRIYTVSLNILSTLKAVFNDMNASSDLQKLVITINKVCEENCPLPSLRTFAHAFKAVSGINRPRSAFNRFYSIYSGEAATQEPFEHHYDWLRVGNKVLFLLSDILKTIKWLHEIGFLTKYYLDLIKTIPSFIPTAAIIAGSALSAFDNLRLVFKYMAPRDDTLAGERKFKLIAAALDLESDICRIASSILLPFPLLPTEILAITTSALGSLLPLVKFYIDETTRTERAEERAQVEVRKAAALQLVERELEIAATALHHPTVSREAIQRVEQVMHTLGAGRIQRQLQTVHALAMETLANAIGQAPAAAPLQQLQTAWIHLQMPVPAVG
jgi:hypothetical protein